MDAVFSPIQQLPIMLKGNSCYKNDQEEMKSTRQSTRKMSHSREIQIEEENKILEAREIELKTFWGDNTDRKDKHHLRITTPI